MQWDGVTRVKSLVVLVLVLDFFLILLLLNIHYKYFFIIIMRHYYKLGRLVSTEFPLPILLRGIKREAVLALNVNISKISILNLIILDNYFVITARRKHENSVSDKTIVANAGNIIT